jgi:hypothetical protein
MNSSTQLAKHLKDVHFGGNWTWSNLKDQLTGITWQQATTQVYGCNTIATLVFHINYFVDVALKVLQGGAISGNDKLSFAHPPINCQQDWDNLVSKALTDAETFEASLAQLPESKLWEDFSEKKYGNYYRNMLGIIEHTHYHLGQIAIIKKIVQQQNSN